MNHIFKLKLHLSCLFVSVPFLDVSYRIFLLFQASNENYSTMKRESPDLCSRLAVVANGKELACRQWLTVRTSVVFTPQMIMSNSLHRIIPLFMFSVNESDSCSFLERQTVHKDTFVHRWILFTMLPESRRLRWCWWAAGVLALPVFAPASAGARGGAGVAGSRSLWSPSASTASARAQGGGCALADFQLPLLRQDPGGALKTAAMSAASWPRFVAVRRLGWSWRQRAVRRTPW